MSAINIKRHGGWKSEAMVEEYVRESKKAKKDTAAAILGTTTTSTTPSTERPLLDGAVLNNCTININYK